MGIPEAIANQYHAVLNMLGQAIELCPEPLWLSASGASPNRFWHIANHALFYTHFYLAPSEAAFIPWRSYQRESRLLAPDPSRLDEPQIVDAQYTRHELLEYAQFCHHEVDAQTKALDLDAPSGFHWLPFNKLELQFYNIRHAAHHAGQLSERLRSQANLGVSWVL
jgi:hypothetical protein